MNASADELWKESQDRISSLVKQTYIILDSWNEYMSRPYDERGDSPVDVLFEGPETDIALVFRMYEADDPEYCVRFGEVVSGNNNYYGSGWPVDASYNPDGEEMMNDLVERNAGDALHRAIKDVRENPTVAGLKNLREIECAIAALRMRIGKRK